MHGPSHLTRIPGLVIVRMTRVSILVEAIAYTTLLF